MLVGSFQSDLVSDSESARVESVYKSVRGWLQRIKSFAEKKKSRRTAIDGSAVGVDHPASRARLPQVTEPEDNGARARARGAAQVRLPAHARPAVRRPVARRTSTSRPSSSSSPGTIDGRRSTRAMPPARCSSRGSSASSARSRGATGRGRCATSTAAWSPCWRTSLARPRCAPTASGL